MNRTRLLAALAVMLAAPALGAQQHPQIIKEFGGVYDDPNVTSYVAIVASRLECSTAMPTAAEVAALAEQCAVEAVNV